MNDTNQPLHRSPLCYAGELFIDRKYGKYPPIFPIFKYREELEGDIRVLLYGHYRVAYIITDNNIDILGVFHGALDIERYFP